MSSVGKDGTQDPALAVLICIISGFRTQNFQDGLEFMQSGIGMLGFRNQPPAVVSYNIVHPTHNGMALLH